MSELKQLIIALIRGERSFEDASQALDRVLAQRPEAARDVARLLRAAREKGLPHHLFVALNGRLSRRTGPAQDPDATRFADDDPQATRVDGHEGTTRNHPPHGRDATRGDARGDRTLDGESRRDRTLDGESRRDSTLRPGPVGERTEPGAAGARADATSFANDEARRAGRPARGDDTDMARLAAAADAATTTGAGTDDGFALFRDDTPGAAARAHRGASPPTAPPPSGQAVAGVDREFHEGDLLRARFELISKLGEGGMGAVWKGKDKLKEEARDRNPYVAIKLLQGDFRAHPEAFIALQRETAKQQRLAHPNIATVYDFDRDDATGTVFMTMEVLEGQPLDAFIRKLPADGLPEEEAMPLIEQLANGLSYAHQAGLVHSDLKPGNCFLTKDGSIKLLDFGIARASKTKSDADGETTLFDPGQLGALTPTYATLEMFEGEDPDPRDDIYALAIMAYQLLTGRHPYAKRSAPKAKELGLAPEPIARLTKAQNRGLARGLAFQREDRTPTVEDFLDSITRKKSRAGPWLAGAAVVLALAVAGAWGPVERLIDAQREEHAVGLVQQGGPESIRSGLAQARALGEESLARVLADPRTVDTVAAWIASHEDAVAPGLALIAGYPADWQQRVKEDPRARSAIMRHHEKRIAQRFSPAEQRYDYPGAMQAWSELDALYPDSAQVFQLRSTLEDAKRETLADLGTRYKQLKDAGRLVPVAHEPDISDVLQIVRTIDPEYFLLKDENLRFRFAEEAQAAIERDRDYARASALLEASAAYAPDDAKLNGLRYDLDRILTRIDNEQRIAELEERLGRAEPTLASLDDFQRVRDDLVALSDLSPDSALLARLRSRLEAAFDAELSRLAAAGRWQRGEERLFEFARLFDIPDLTARRLALSEAARGAGHEGDAEATRARAAERVAAIEALLAAPEFTREWELRLRAPYRELIALRPLDSPEVEKVRTGTARLLLGAAREARDQENFNRAREFVRKGLEFYPGLANFDDEARAIDRAEQAFLARRAEEERLAAIETLKSEFRETVEANDVQAANRTLAEITGQGLAADDPFLATAAPKLLAGAYQRLAAQAARGDDFLSAVELARAGLSLDPTLDALADSLGRYEAESRKRERELRLARRFDSLDPLDVAEVRRSLAALGNDFPDRIDAMSSRFADSRAARLRAHARAPDVDVATLAARAEEFRALFPRAGAALAAELADAVASRLARADVGSAARVAAIVKPLDALRTLSDARHAAASAELAARALAAVRRLESSDKGAAAALLRAAQAAFPAHRELAALSIAVPLEELDTARAQLGRGQLAAAARSVAAARSREPGHPEIGPVDARVTARRADADRAYAAHEAKAADPLGYKARDEVRELYRQAVALCSDCGFAERQPAKPVAGLCHAGLAGFGSRRAGQCWDQAAREKGPMMVVVPAGAGAAAPFAIGKYEVSQRDFNVFCKTTSRCKVVLGSKSRLPATGIAAALAEEYASWLSGEASRALDRKVVYRLPSAGEWEHAARADGAQPERTFNCRVTSGGSVIAGHDLVDARSGQENGWGLANYVGNAQELVRDGAGFAVRGGDFQVPLTRCDVAYSQPHDGSADPTTGFRLVRELD